MKELIRKFAKYVLKSDLEDLNYEISNTNKRAVLSEEYNRELRLEREALKKENSILQSRLHLANLVLDKIVDQKEVETCLSKQTFESENAADWAAVALFYKDGRKLESYKCIVCCKYHHTKSNRSPRLIKESEKQTGLKVSIGDLLKDKING